jgi:hypothetical protein
MAPVFLHPEERRPLDKKEPPLHSRFQLRRRLSRDRSLVSFADRRHQSRQLLVAAGIQCLGDLGVLRSAAEDRRKRSRVCFDIVEEGVEALDRRQRLVGNQPRCQFALPALQRGDDEIVLGREQRQSSPLETPAGSNEEGLIGGILTLLGRRVAAGEAEQRRYPAGTGLRGSGDGSKGSLLLPVRLRTVNGAVKYKVLPLWVDLRSTSLTIR